MKRQIIIGIAGLILISLFIAISGCGGGGGSSVIPNSQPVATNTSASTINPTATPTPIKYGNISGKVLTNTGTGYANAFVEFQSLVGNQKANLFENSASYTQTTTSLTDGSYSFNNVPQGDCRVSFWANQSDYQLNPNNPIGATNNIITDDISSVNLVQGQIAPTPTRKPTPTPTTISSQQYLFPPYSQDVLAEQSPFIGTRQMYDERQCVYVPKSQGTGMTYRIKEALQTLPKNQWYTFEVTLQDCGMTSTEKFAHAEVVNSDKWYKLDLTGTFPSGWQPASFDVYLNGSTDIEFRIYSEAKHDFAVSLVKIWPTTAPEPTPTNPPGVYLFRPYSQDVLAEQSPFIGTRQMYDERQCVYVPKSQGTGMTYRIKEALQTLPKNQWYTFEVTLQDCGMTSTEKFAHAEVVNSDKWYKLDLTGNFPSGWQPASFDVYLNGSTNIEFRIYSEAKHDFAVSLVKISPKNSTPIPSPPSGYGGPGLVYPFKDVKQWKVRNLNDVNTHPSPYQLDFYIPGGGEGTEIIAVAPGTVTESSSGYNNGYGNTIKITHENGFVSQYNHLKDGWKATVNTKVGYGTTIGYCGNTGFSFGNHLHFEFRDKDGYLVDVLNDSSRFDNRALPVANSLFIEYLEVFKDLHVIGVTDDKKIWHTIRKIDGTWQNPFGDVKEAAGNVGNFIDMGYGNHSCKKQPQGIHLIRNFQ